MKKIIYPLIAGIIVVTLTACGSEDAGQQDKAKDQKQSSQTKQKNQANQAEETQKKLEDQKVEDKETVAIVNNKQLMGREYNMALSSVQMQMQQMGQDPTSKDAAKQIKEQTINNLVGQTLILQDADKKGYKASNEEVEKKLTNAKQQYKDDKAFQAALKQAGLDMETLKSKSAESIKFSKYVEKEIPVEAVTDKEIQTYYDQMAQQGNAGGKELPKLEEVKPQIKQQLQQQKQQAQLTKQVEELKKNAVIDIKI
ncbi:SurA N-terminal domain-containing protein [Peribacillus kribbensis]|uniref:SurA N-terminal domain-containing protein n=1 Tax=Peribacillus kribbensis TaxID=356658 RepID=UPI000407BE44|nr:SurA N-terminal domain-containing protein [Peribacillus kribbensis]